MDANGPEDVFVDDIKLLAADGQALAATLFLPRGQRKRAILINSATAVPRKIYRAFATYLAGHGVSKARIASKGLGEAAPLYNPETSDTERAANRRVEIRLVPYTG